MDPQRANQKSTSVRSRKDENVPGVKSTTDDSFFPLKKFEGAWGRWNMFVQNRTDKGLKLADGNGISITVWIKKFRQKIVHESYSIFKVSLFVGPIFDFVNRGRGACM